MVGLSAPPTSVTSERVFCASGIIEKIEEVKFHRKLLKKAVIDQISHYITQSN